MAYGADRFIYPVADTDSETVVRWEVGGTSYATEIQGQSYVYSASSVSISTANAYPSFLDRLSDDILTKTGVTVTWSWGTPSGYALPDALAFDADDATFGWRFGAMSDFEKSIFGYQGGATTIYATPGTPVVAPRSGIGQWLARTIIGYEATDKRSMSRSESYASTSDPYITTRYTTMRERELRRMQYQWVAGLRVEGGDVRREDPSYAELAEVSTSLGATYTSDGDALGLKEMWRSLRFGRDCLIIQDVGDTVIAPTDDQLDIGPFANADARGDFSALVQDLRAGGELYTVDLMFYLKTKGWDY